MDAPASSLQASEAAWLTSRRVLLPQRCAQYARARRAMLELYHPGAHLKKATPIDVPRGCREVASDCRGEHAALRPKRVVAPLTHLKVGRRARGVELPAGVAAAAACKLSLRGEPRRPAGTRRNAPGAGVPVLQVPDEWLLDCAPESGAPASAPAATPAILTGWAQMEVLRVISVAPDCRLLLPVRGTPSPD